MEGKKKFTGAEVAAHNSESDCWLVINNKVYDVTKYADDHPGGADILTDHAGHDASQDFEDTGHSEDAKKIMQKYYIGDLDGPAEVKGGKKATGGVAGGNSSSASTGGGINPGLIVGILVVIAAALYVILSPK